jgi:hypothetical protein
VRRQKGRVRVGLSVKRTLLAEVSTALLDGADDEVTDRGSGEAVLDTRETLDGDDEEGLGASVVSAVEDGTSGETGGDAELAADLATTAWKECATQRNRAETLLSTVQTGSSMSTIATEIRQTRVRE